MSRRLTLEEVKEFAVSKDGLCLSDAYVNNSSRLIWKCNKCDTQWKAPFNRLKSKKSWCPRCARAKKRLTLEEMQNIAKEKDGKCLSKVYINSNSLMEWECNVCGKIWKAKPDNIKQGKWCSRCVKCEKLTIVQMKELAISKNGECLSEVYKNSNSPLKWKCNVCNKIWHASPGNVKSGTWCPRCTKHEKLTIDQMKQLAISKDGECLSTVYVNVETDLLWKCDVCKTEWKARPDNIKTGTWCPKCAGTKKKTLEDIKELAKIRGGKCLSEEYINCEQNILWECGACGRTWKATPNNVRRGTWCPYCHRIGEESCRKIFESIFKVPFPKIRPSWMRNGLTGRKLELDGFNEKLNIAFEYNGLQHYELVKPFHSSMDDLKKGMARDQLKKKFCEEKGIILFVIPPLRIKHKDLPYLTQETFKNFILKMVKEKIPLFTQA